MVFHSRHNASPGEDLIGSAHVGQPEDFQLFKETRGWLPQSIGGDEMESEDYRYFKEDEDDIEARKFLEKANRKNLQPKDPEVEERKRRLGFIGKTGEIRLAALKTKFWDEMKTRMKKRTSQPAWVKEAADYVRSKGRSPEARQQAVEEVAREMTMKERLKKKTPDQMPGLQESLNCLTRWRERAEAACNDFMHEATEVTSMIKELRDDRLGDGDGDSWYEMAVKCYDRMPTPPTPIQKEFLLKHFLYVNLPHIYQHEFLRNKAKILARLKRETIHKAAMLTCPRQFGKSTTTAMGSASLLYVGRGINIVMVANSQGSASDLMKKTMINYVAVSGLERVIFKNQKMCCVTRADVSESEPKENIVRNGWFNTVRACSGNAKSQRGINASIIILDEAAFINKAMLEEVIGPLIKVRNTTIIALSTHSGAENWFSRIFKRKDKQIERIVTRMQVKFMCDDCETKGFKTCEHMRHLQPKWHDAESKELIQLFITNEQLYAQEIMGKIIGSNDGCFFNHDFMDFLFKRPKPPIQTLHTRTLLTFIDPKGTSEHSSYFAVCTVLITPTDCVLLVGFDETKAALGPNKDEFLKDYFSALVHHEIYTPKTKMIVCTENNYSASESYFWSDLARRTVNLVHPNAEVLEYYEQDQKAGARTFENTKKEAASMLFSDFLCNSVYLCPDWVCTKESERRDIQKAFVNQMTNMRVHANGTIHGKLNKMEHDDMAIVFMLSVHRARAIKNAAEIKRIIYRDMIDLKKTNQGYAPGSKDFAYNYGNFGQEAPIF